MLKQRGRFASTRHTRLGLWLLNAAVLGAIAAAGWLVWQGMTDYVRTSNEHRVQRIQIDGLESLEESVIAAAAGVTKKDSILLVQPAEVEERLMKLPYIKACKVTRIFPDTINIRIEERKPVALLAVDSKCFYIDADCVALEEVTPARWRPGPFITLGSTLNALTPGDIITAPELRAALDILGAFSRTEMSKEVTITELAATSVNDIRMYCEQLPFEIRWGRGQPVLQAKRLDALWSFKNKDLGCIEYCDLRFGKTVACR